MRMKLARCVAFLVVIIDTFVVYYSIGLLLSSSDPPTTSPSAPPFQHHPTLTVVIREFEPDENDVSATVRSLLAGWPNLSVLILYDQTPYPPLDITVAQTASNVKSINVKPNLKTSFVESQPLFHIRTIYTLFIPDSSRIISKQSLLDLVNANESFVAVPVGGKALQCSELSLNQREWTLKYNPIKNVTCDAVKGKHAILIESKLLKKLPSPFLLPFPQAFYVQTAAQNLKVKIYKKSIFQEGKPLMRSHHAQMNLKQLQHERFRQVFGSFGIKLVVKENDAEEWYGCTRDTPRCFGPILDSMPSYLYEGKWTPPCCLANLRKTARHVFSVLEENGVRYWLEAGSLLGAMRNGDILPWDYDVDVGFYTGDLERNPWLKKAALKPVVDSKGFLWEKATEGNFYRVHYGKKNKIHVNIFPFYPKNGTMIKDAWFTSHKNMEFGEHFLHPMSSIEFVGRKVPSPNNIRDFLEMKFGKDAIENPQYPDPSKLRFPNL